MADLHIDDFYKDCARVLVHLYRNFPRRCAIYVEDISGPDQADEYGLHSTRHLACFGAMLWLAEHGYLHYETTIRQEAVDQAVLSHMGFNLLASYGDQNRSTATAADPITADLTITQLRQALKSGSSNRLALTVQQLLLRSAHFR